MSAIPQQLIESQKEALNTVVAFQSTLFGSFEKLVDLNVQAIKATLNETAEQTQQLAAVKEPQDAVSVFSSFAQPNAEKALAYSKHVYNIFSGLNSELAKFSEAQVAQGQKQVNEALEQISKNAPAGSEGAVALVKSSIATVSSAVDSLNKAAKQAAEVAESNIAAATNATLKATETATKTTARK